MGIDREEAGRRMIEIIDGVLQLLKDVLLALELAGDVGDRPDRLAGGMPALAERAHPHPQPAPGLALAAADPHLLLQPPAFAGGAQQAIDRFRHARIADENPLDRAGIVGARGLGEFEIGRVGIDHAAAGIGHQEAVMGAVDDRLDDRAPGFGAAHAQDAGRQRQQQEHAGHGQQRQERQEIGLGIGAPDQDQAGAGAGQHHRHEQHQADAAAVAAATGAVDGDAGGVARQAGRIGNAIQLRHEELATCCAGGPAAHDPRQNTSAFNALCYASTPPTESSRLTQHQRQIRRK